MPSLRRRDLSSSSVRSSPYRPSLVSSTTTSSSPRNFGAHPRRRSSKTTKTTKTETRTRKVLADIEWWRILDGQHILDAERAFEERYHTLVASGTALNDGDLERPSTPINQVIENYPLPPSPQTPTTPVHRAPRYDNPHTPTTRWHDIFDLSSLDSSPEEPVTSLESLRLGIQDLDLHSPTPSHTKPPSHLLSIHIDSLADFVLSYEEQGGITGDYADFTISPSSSCPLGLFD